MLCFSLAKRRLFNELSAERHGCVINSRKAGKDAICINDYSTVEEKELGFFQDPGVEYMSINDVINQVALDSKVNVRGVVILDQTRTVRAHGEDVSIREGYLVDETSRNKLTLWREYRNLLDNRSTYDLKNVVINYIISDSIPRGLKMRAFNSYIKGGRAHIKAFQGATAKRLHHYILPTLEE